MTRTLLRAVVLSVTIALPAAAAERDRTSSTTPAHGTALAPAPAAAADELIDAAVWRVPPVQASAPSRGRVLPALYVSFAALQVYDGYTTTTGVARGAREANGAVAGVAANRAAFWAVKGGASALSFYMAERLWKHHHRGHAIVMMVTSNILMGVVAAQNSAVLRASDR